MAAPVEATVVVVARDTTAGVAVEALVVIRAEVAMEPALLVPSYLHPGMML